MSLSLYDTAARSARAFVPIEPGRASIYLCGATVQAPPHIGHVRSGIAFDILSRWLTYSGYDVTFIRNVTDIDDKIITKAAENQVPYWQHAAVGERAFTWAYDTLGCLRPTYEPRATGHVTEMIVLMQRLIDAGHAYAAEGDVYFDVRSWPSYGSLSGQKPDEMLASADSVSTAKRDVRDFALWKGAKPGEPSWPTPWGDGRPGWHLECSAMAGKYLGPAFDIHGGGLDLVFPHHENEMAQSQSVGDAFAGYWMHNAWVTSSGEKMGKSLGNSLLVTEVVQRVRPVELRFYLGSAHYRSHIEYSETALNDAAAGYRRIESFLMRAREIVGTVPPDLAVPATFAAALDDDLGVPQALAVLYDTVRAGNAALAEGRLVDVSRAVAEASVMLGVLGLDPVAEPWAGDRGSDELRPVVDALVQVALGQRADARTRKDFAAADAVRDGLKGAGILIEDTPTGPRWTLAATTTSTDDESES